MYKNITWLTIPRCVLFLCTLSILSGCAGDRFAKTSDSLLYKPWGDTISCTGIPTKKEILNDRTTIVEWDYDADHVNSNLSMATVAAILSPVLSVPAGLVTGSAISVSGAGDCKIIATITDGQIVKFNFGGSNRTITSGKNGVCEPVFRGCEK